MEKGERDESDRPPIRKKRLSWQTSRIAPKAASRLDRFLVRVPNLYFGSRLGAQYPKNSKIFL